MPFAVSIRYTGDFGLAYGGGVEAWASGHPERVTTWFSTPFLALVMAVITRLGSEQVTAHVFLAANVLLWGALLVAIWSRLYGRVPQIWWWGTLLAAAVFSPAISGIFWLSFNLAVFALVLSGFVLIGRHDRLAGLLIGASLALKPILLLLPFALLLRRQSRAAGAWAIVAAAGLSAAALVFLAWRAGDASVLDPFAYLAAFVAKGHRPFVECVTQNYSPLALLCRLGVPSSTPLTLAVAAALLAIGWLAIRVLRYESDPGWGLFAVASLLSPMVGPIEWATYQILFAPLLLLLAYQFWAERAPVFLWLNLAAVYVLTMLVWDALETVAGTPLVVLVEGYMVGELAQYFLLLLGIQWVRMRSARVARA